MVNLNPRIDTVVYHHHYPELDSWNEAMLGKLQSQVHVIPCIDDVDETRSTAKWHQKAAKQLE